MSVRLGQFMERSGVLPSTQFAYWKGVGTCEALLCVPHSLKNALESGQEDRIVHRLISAQLLIGSTIREGSTMGAISMKSITTCYGGLLSELTGSTSCLE